MTRKNTFLFAICLIYFMAVSASSADGQHEGHDPGTITRKSDTTRPRVTGDETPCQRVARLAADLEDQFNLITNHSNPSDLQRGLAEHKLKLAELREATHACAQQCEKLSSQHRRRRGCGHSMTRH